MPFQFRLDSVLRDRRYREDVAVLALAEAERRLGSLRVRLAAHAADTLACRGTLGERAARGGAGALLAALAGTLEALHARSARCAAEIAEQQRRILEARASLVEATRGRRVLERLLESARAAHTRRVEALEQSEADDLASSGLLWRASQVADRVGGAR